MRLPGVLAFALLIGAGARASVPRAGEDPVADQIRALVGGSAGEVAVVRGVRLASPGEVRRFYGGREFSPAWTAAGPGMSRVDSMLAAVHAADLDGLRPEDYHVDVVTALARRVAAPMGAAPAQRAELDVLLTDAFLTLARHRVQGRIGPRELHEGWTLPVRSGDACALLNEALVRGAPGAALRKLDPAVAEYDSLRAALGRYRSPVAQRWPVVPAGDALRPGAVDGAVAVLRARLAAEAGSTASDTSSFFDAALEADVRRYQRTRGLEVDGVVGPATRASLAVPASYRARQIVLNLERLRWQGERPAVSIEVAVPAFELRLFERDSVVMLRRIIGGRPDWPTPIFGSRVEAVIFSPYWNVPSRIAVLEVLPKVRRDPGWLAREHMRVLSGWGTDARVIDASSINWARVTAATFPYRFRQDPGPANPLGGVKFSIPSRWDVYLHDTSEPKLFERAQRSFSHGCMRLERPLDLAEYLLRGDTIWSRAAIEAAASAAVERTVRLRRPVPLHVVYRTAWLDGDGLLHLRPDLYGHDERLARRLGLLWTVRAEQRDAVGDSPTQTADCA